MTTDILPSISKEHRGLKLLFDVQRDPLGYFTKLMHKEGPFAWLNLNGQLLLMLNDATGIQHVFQDNASNYRKAHFSQVLKPLLGNGIFLSEGKLWRKQRQEAAPVFANGNFEDMLSQMIAATEAMFQRWEPRIARGEAIDLTIETMWLTLDVLLRALFHEARDGVAASMQLELGKVLREAEGRIWSIFNLPQKLVLSLPKYKTAMAFLDDLVMGLIESRRSNGAYPDDLLSRLIASYGSSPEDLKCLRDQVMSFMLAGHETTAHSLSWSFYSLCRHPVQQQRMVEEIDDILQSELPTLDTIKRLTYSKQVFDEVLRLYPPVWTMSRETIGDDVIPLDDGRKIPLPKDTVVMLCDYAVHRREAYWSDPEAFDPDRFKPAAVLRRPKFAWFPFGGGPRLCLGFRFAQTESLVALAMILQRYKLTLVPGQTIKPLPIITLRPDGPILFQIRKRETTPSVVPEPEIQHVEETCPYPHAKRA
jgi:cytochrome P450